MTRFTLPFVVLLALGCGGTPPAPVGSSEVQKQEMEASKKKLESHVQKMNELGKFQAENAKQRIAQREEQEAKERDTKSEPSDDVSYETMDEQVLSNRAVAESKTMKGDQIRSVARLMVKAGQLEEFDEKEVAFLDQFPANKEKIRRGRKLAELFPPKKSPPTGDEKSE